MEDIEVPFIRQPDPINGKTVLAFLQNPYHSPGILQRYVDMYREDMFFRRKCLARTKTGQWLTRTIGPDLYWKIWWDNASPKHGFVHTHEERYDADHMLKVLQLVKPNIIIAFGRQARNGVNRIDFTHEPYGLVKPVVMHAPHPMARGNQIPALEELARRLREELGC